MQESLGVENFGPEELSRGNVQRAGEVAILIAANLASASIFSRSFTPRSLAERNHGAAVLLVREELDDRLEFADRIVVIFVGGLVYPARIGVADPIEIGRHLAGH